MHRPSAILLVVVIAASLLTPIGLSGTSEQIPGDAALGADGPLASSILGEIPFSMPLDTSAEVPEYILASRALMLAGGSTDVALADVDDDGLDDLVVAVSGDQKGVSIFCGQPSGEYLSYPSYNISLDRTPISLAVLDVNGTGENQIAVLQQRATPLEVDRFEILDYNSTSSSFVQLFESRHVAHPNAIALLAGAYSGDSYDDLVVLCGGDDPSTNPGYIELWMGPILQYPLSSIDCGLGPSSVVSSDFDSDGDEDIAVANYVDSSVMIFEQPFSDDMSPDLTINLDANPTSIASGLMDTGTTSDLVVATENPSMLHYFFQSLGSLDTDALYEVPLDVAPSALEVADVTGDSRQDVIVLSSESSRCEVVVQQASSPVWGPEDMFVFPTGTMPRNAVTGDMDPRAGVEIAIASAGPDWDGSSLGLYFDLGAFFSNANETVWTNANYLASDIEVGDLDGDGENDLVSIYPSSNSFSYLRSFAGSPVNIALGFSPDLLLVRDVNGDGLDDIVVGGGSRDNLTIGLGAESLGSSMQTVEVDCGGNVTGLDCGDLDSDGLLDLVVSTDNGDIEIFYNDGSANPYPTSDVISTVDESVACVVVGDFDSDGKDDIAYPAAPKSVSVLFQKDSAVPFSLPADLTLTITTGSGFTSLWAGDVDGNGEDDIAAARPADASVYIFDQIGDSAYPSAMPLPAIPSLISLLDFTDDGLPDLLIAFESADLVFLYRQATGAIPSSPSMVFVTGATPVDVTFADSNGDHRADLLVCDSISHSVSVWDQVNRAPTAHSGGPYTVGQGYPLEFDGSATTELSEVPYMEYLWEFGDGESTDWVLDPNPVHAYMSLGTFEVNVSVRDPLGLTDTDHTTVTVVDSYPVVDFEWTPSSPVEGEEVVFVDTTWSYDPVVLINWTVDGDLVSTGLETSITVDEFDDGYHEVHLEVTDDDGSVGELTQSVFVRSANPVVSISSPAQVDEGESALFEAIVDDWHGGPVDPIVLYEWDFSYSGSELLVDAFGTDDYVVWSFEAVSASETYTVAVRVTDGDGNWTIATTEIEVLDVGPDALVSLSVASPGEGEPFTFIASDSHDGVTDWLWTLYDPGGGSQVFSETASAMGNMSFVLGNGSYEMDLQVTEGDGDTDSFTLAFAVAELAPSVDLQTVPELADIEEFERVDFSALVDSYDDIESYEWDFVAPGAQFVADRATETGTTHFTYNWTGNYTARVKVTDVDGSIGYGDVDIEVLDLDLTGAFVDDVEVLRLDENHTCEVTFDASSLSERFPDIANTLWHFGDGTFELVIGPPSSRVMHTYDPVRDYEVNLTLTDDDGNTLFLSETLRMIQPTIQLVGPQNGAVVNSGIPIRFVVSDDSLPFESVTYSVDGGPALPFETLYSIDTSAWSDDSYSIEVRAEDKDGNIAIADGVSIIIDDTAPEVDMIWDQNTTYAGGRMNISIRVTDPNVDPEGVTLYVRMPGDDAFSSLEMNPAPEGEFYRNVDVPMRSGQMEFYVVVEDLAGNSQVSETFTVAVKKHFVDAFWPFMLVGALLAALGTGAYFFKESRIAVDETFVIYGDGRLMAHSTRRLKPGMDDQVLGSMFVAVQDFVRDSFKEETSFTLRKLDFGSKTVLVEKGANFFLAVVLHGKASRKVSSRMARVVEEIDDRFGVHLGEWDGDLDKVRGVNDIMTKLYSRAPAFPGSPRRGDG